MDWVILLAIGGLLVLVYWWRRGETTKIGQITAQRIEHKQSNLDTIINYLNTHETITNEQARAILGHLTAMTVVRYMDELELDGKIKQIGKTGQNVIYSRT